MGQQWLEQEKPDFQKSPLKFNVRNFICMLFVKFALWTRMKGGVAFGPRTQFLHEQVARARSVQGGSSDGDKMKAKNGTKARTSQGESKDNKMI